MTTLGNLFAAMESAMTDQAKTRNTSIAKAIGAIIKQNYRSRENLDRVDQVLRSNHPTASVSPTVGGPQEWRPGAKKKKSAPGSKVTPPVPAVTAKDIIKEDFDVDELVGLTPHDLLKKVGDFAAAKRIATDLALGVDSNLSAQDFLEAMAKALKEQYGKKEIPELTPEKSAEIDEIIGEITDPKLAPAEDLPEPVADHADDLAAIKGIAAKTAAALNELGIFSFSDLSEADPEDIKTALADRSITASISKIKNWKRSATDKLR